MALLPLVFTSLPSVKTSFFGYGRGFPDFLRRLVWVTLGTFGPAMLLGGMVFPLLVAWRSEDSLAGRRLALLLAVNGVGGVVGAETAYRILLPSFAVYVSIGVVGACYALVAIAVVATLRTNRGVPYLFPLAALLLISYVTRARLVGIPVYSYANIFKVVDMRAGREGSLVVAEDSRGDRDMILDNQYTLGGSAGTATMRREAHLPLLFHPAPRRVAFIGLGTGITASGALEHHAVKSITAVELSPLVAQAGARDFGQFNHNVYHDPRVRVHIEDARIYLESAKKQFDVVIGDLFTPWRPGEASLSSLEQFRACREALRPGGVFCQWIELTQWTPEQFRMIADTFKSAFGHLYLVHTQYKTDHIPLGLLGFKDGGPDWGTVGRECALEARAGALVDPMCRHVEGVAMLYLGEYKPSVPPSASLINTLGNLRIELSACRQVVAGNPATYFAGDGANWLNLVQRQVESMLLRKELPESLARYPGLGLVALRFERAAAAHDPSAAVLARDLVARMPSSLLSDPGSDASLWPWVRPPWTFLGVRGR
jgi:spermidine synthase